MVFQDPMTSLNPVFTIGDQMGAILKYADRRLGRARGAAGRRARIHEVLRQVRMPDPERIARAYPIMLSGGMRQRVLIAMALLSEPRLLIADEPGTALDVTTQAQILKLLKDLVEARGLALLMITHNLGVVREAADYVYVMYAGAVVEHAPTAALFAGPRHPYTRALIDCVPKLSGETTLQAASTARCPTMPRRRPAAASRRAARSHAVRCRSDAGAALAAAGGSRGRSSRGLVARRAGLAAIRALGTRGVWPARSTIAPTSRGVPWPRCSKSSACPRASRSAAVPGRVRGAVRAVNEVSFRIEAGEVFGLAGESGSGKSTIARMIMGLATPTEGAILFEGREITGSIGARAHGKLVQMVFQNPGSSLNPRRSIGQSIEMPLRARGLARREI